MLQRDGQKSEEMYGTYLQNRITISELKQQRHYPRFTTTSDLAPPSGVGKWHFQGSYNCLKTNSASRHTGRNLQIIFKGT